LRFAAGALAETLFSLILMPAVALRLTIFMVSLVFGRAVNWNGQERDAHGLSWFTAASGLWPQFLAGCSLLAVLWSYAPGAIPWAAPMLAGFLFAVPFAVGTASPAFGAFLARIGLCAIPEEAATPPEVKALDAGLAFSPARASGDAAARKSASVQQAA